MNTIIKYLYRDASNYKNENVVIVFGELSSEQLERIISCLFEGEYFVPRCVGLPESRIMDYRTDDDHCYFEWENFESPELTEEPATVNITTNELVENFEKVKKWDENSWENDYPYKSYTELGVCYEH